MRAFKVLSTVALSTCWAEILEESSLLQINHLKGDADSDCFREGRCGPGVTTPPPTLAPTGICTVSGDPHIKTFDSPEVNVHYYYNGDYYLVKSQFLNIQARYWSSAKSGKSSVKGLAVGGDIMEGRVLMIEPGNGMIRLDGVEVKLEESGSMTVGTGTLSSVPPGKGEKKGPLLTLNFPNDDVTVKVKRLTHLLNVIVEMRPEVGQDGHCGNFNGILEDDDLGSIKTRMGTSLRFPETMFPVMAATLLGCSKEAFGDEVGTYLNTNECNMMCSQRGSSFMANRDETCYCGNANAPKLFQASCQVSCEDPETVDAGFCVYSMAKPAPTDTSTKCLLNEKMVVAKCAKALQSAADRESCKIDICSNGDLAGTLSYLLDWKATDQKERKKLAAKKQRERKMSVADIKKKAAQRKAARDKKAQNAKNTREKRNAAAKVKKQKERAIKKKQRENSQTEKQNKDALSEKKIKDGEMAKKKKDDQTRSQAQKSREAEKALALKKKQEQAKKDKAAREETKNKNQRAQVAKAKAAAVARKKAERDNKARNKNLKP